MNNKKVVLFVRVLFIYFFLFTGVAGYTLLAFLAVYC